MTKRGLRLKETTNEYRLTYFATRERTPTGAYEWSAPTNEWKRRAGKSFFSRAESDTQLGQKVTLTGLVETAKSAEILDPDLGRVPIIGMTLRPLCPDSDQVGGGNAMCRDGPLGDINDEPTIY